eukprot:403344753
MVMNFQTKEQYKHRQQAKEFLNKEESIFTQRQSEDFHQNNDKTTDSEIYFLPDLSQVCYGSLGVEYDIYKDLFLQNVMQMKVNIQTKRDPKLAKGKMMMRYMGQSQYFTGSQFKSYEFVSVNIFSNTTYKAQIAPTHVSQQTNIVSLHDSYQDQFKFTLQNPEYDGKPASSSQNIQIFSLTFRLISFNRPIKKVTIYSVNILTALAKIGGYIKIFGLVKISLVVINTWIEKYCTVHIQRAHKTVHPQTRSLRLSEFVQQACQLRYFY